MTAVLTIVAVGLQLVLYREPIPQSWIAHSLPLIVAISFSISLVRSEERRVRRLFSDRFLGSFLIGTYHRPKCEQRSVRFLGLLDSSALAEQASRPSRGLVRAGFCDV